VFAPLARRVADEPAQMAVALVFTNSVGFGTTESDATTVEEHPALL
jgi:hypothetical protein